MKYYNLKDIKNRPTFIAKMMMNLMSGKYIWNEKTGNLNDKVKNGYNTYDIDKISYDVFPTVGVIIIMQKTRLIDAGAVKNAYATLHEQIHINPIVGEQNTDHYVVVSKKNPSPLQYYMLSNPLMRGNINKVTDTINFSWLFCDHFYSDMPFCIPDVSPYKINQEALSYLSLSTLVFDVEDYIDIEHATSSPNLPLAKDYRILASGNVCQKMITYSYLYGINKEIASDYFQVHGNIKITQPIFWMKWEDVKPMCLRKNDMPFGVQLANDLLTPYEGDSPKCIITGMPIYEDCYVLDIYKYTKNTEINEDELLPTDEIIRKPLTKKGIPVKLVVKRLVNSDKPMHVFISSVAMHGCVQNKTLVDHIQDTYNCKCIVYRSFCPIMCYDIIEKMDKPPVYKNILHGLNRYAKYKGNNVIESQTISIDNSTILLLPQIDQTHIFGNVNGIIGCVNFNS